MAKKEKKLPLVKYNEKRSQGVNYAACVERLRKLGKSKKEAKEICQVET